MSGDVGLKARAWQPSSLLANAGEHPIHTCPGCGHPIVIKMLAAVLEEMGLGGRAVGVVGATCGGVAGSLVQVDWITGGHGRPADMATGIKRVRPHLIVTTYQGDGDCMAIGMEGTMHAALRGECITIIMVNNANYGTTGGQMAPTTPLGMRTTTTPEGRDPRVHGYPVHAAELLSGIQGVAYSARGSVTSPAHYQKTKRFIQTAFEKQVTGAGLSFVEILSPCPPDWHLTPLDSMARIDKEMIPEFPVGEFKNVDRKD